MSYNIIIQLRPWTVNNFYTLGNRRIANEPNEPFFFKNGYKKKPHY